MNSKISGKWSSFLLTAAMTTMLTVVPGYAAAADTSFSDVEAGAYYEEAVEWAVEKEITNGTSEGIFSPEADCTRGQMVTFIYKVFGEGATAGGSAFNDVSRESYYYDAVNWAVSRGITTGVSRTNFNPEGKCTRAQAVTFMSRVFSVNDLDYSSIESFGDVTSNDYYYDAVRWAVKEGIAKGTGNGNFSPSGICNRAQIVTFLYRFSQLQEKALPYVKANNPEDLIVKYGSVMEEAQFYNRSGGNAGLLDAYFTSERKIWDVSGRQVLIKDSDGTYYGEELNADGTASPLKVVFGNEESQSDFDWAMSVETGMIRLLDNEVLVKDVYSDGGDTVIVIENHDVLSDYRKYVDKSYKGDVALVAEFRFSDEHGGRLTGMTADYRLGNGQTLKAMKTCVFYGNEPDAEGLLLGERTFKYADTLKAALKGSDTRSLKWIIDPGTGSERVIQEKVPKGVGFLCVLRGSDGLYYDEAMTRAVDSTKIDLNSDLVVYSAVKQ
ncbi:MAG: S-layer homology domain-containing protein [Clostridia bacterium]|nr:S-layer homology domain-containing protein [Clostridia bacterium]